MAQAAGTFRRLPRLILQFEYQGGKEQTMEKFIPYEKLSKKKKRELDACRRGGWGSLSPVTRRPDNPRAYKRKKTRPESEEDAFGCVFFLKAEVDCGRVLAEKDRGGPPYERAIPPL